MDTVEKAYEILQKCRIKLVHNTVKSTWYEVKSMTDDSMYLIRKTKNDIRCTCRFGTVKIEKNLKERACSHIIAVILYEKEQNEKK